MRRLLVLTLLIGGMWLLILTTSLSLARQDEALTWLYFNNNGRFYRMQADGTEKTQIADVDFYFASWPAKGGSFMASGRRERGSQKFDLFRLDVLGERIRPIARTENSDRFLAWSPDGKGVVFQAEQGQVVGRLYYADLDGGAIQFITPEIYFPTIVSWTVDGWIVINGTLGQENGFFRVRADGSGFEALTPGLSFSQWAGITPNGEWMVFVAYSSSDGFDIYRMRLDGSQLENLTPERVGNSDFAIMEPNGEWIVYRYLEATMTTVGRMRLDGREDQVLLQAAEHQLPIYVSTDGEWLYYLVLRTESRGLYRIQIDGQNVEVIDGNVSGGYDLWSSDGRWYQFVRHTNNNTALEMVVYDSVENKTYPLNELVETAMVGTQVWSADNEWLYYRARHGETRTFERIRPTGTDRQVLTTTQGEFFFVGAGPAVDLQWNADLLTMLGFATIGGGLCGGYWFSRS